MSRRLWRRLKFYGQLVLVLAPLVIFFIVYNRVVVDVNLQRLKLSLRVLGRADAAAKAEAAMTLIDQNLLYTVGLSETPWTEVAGLEYAKGVLASDPRRLVEDAQAVVSTLIAQRIEERGGVIETLDDLNDAVQAAMQRVLLAPRFILHRQPLSDELDVDRLSQAVKYERLGEFVKAEQLYQELLKAHPTYRGRGDLQLRLGYLYHRQRAFASAERMYRQVLRQTRDPVEVGIARQLLAELARARRQSEEAVGLKARVHQTVEPSARQQAAFELGVKQMQGMDFEAAIQSFQLAALAQPGTPWAAHAQFRRAWCLKYLGRYEEALQGFDELRRLAPGTPITAATHVQIADTYRSTGHYEAAAEALEAAASYAQDQALASMLTAQVGSMYLLDLNNPQEAEGYFRRLEEAFPASSLSAVRQTIQQFQAEKTLTRVPVERAKMGIPVLSWLETTLPGFIETFAARLAQYMRNVGETEYRRRLTEDDFRRLVVSRMLERFPNQLSEVQVEIVPEGFQGSMSVRIGLLWFPVAGQIRFVLVHERPHIVIPELTVGHLPVPDALRRLLETRINRQIDEARLALKVKQFDLTHDGVEATVALSKEGGAPSGGP